MRRILLVSGAVLAVGALAACSNAGSSASKRAGGAQLARPAADAPASGDPARRGSIAGGKVANGDGSDSNPARTPSSATGAATVELDGSRIRTAEMTVLVHGARNVATMADKAGDITANAGGEIDSDDRTTGSDATATLRLRVPPTSLRDVLGSLAKLGDEKSRQGSSKDVTEQVADINSRVASAQQAVARLNDLYDHAQKVSDVISIESELSGRESDLESLQAQQRTLGRQTAMASVTLYLQTKPAATPHEKTEQGGFLGGLSRGWHSFGTAAAAAATALGAALPFLVLLVLLVGGLRLIRPRLVRHAAPPPAPAPSK